MRVLGVVGVDLLGAVVLVVGLATVALEARPDLRTDTCTISDPV